jgi:SCY1-like protein 2
LSKSPHERGNVAGLVENQWFQDPLIKAIRYLERIDEKDRSNKLQFLSGLSRILEKFEDRILIKKVIPLMLAAMKDEQIS